MVLQLCFAKLIRIHIHGFISQANSMKVIALFVLVILQKSNNGNCVPEGRITATIEFTDEISKEDIIDNLSRISLHPKYLAHKYNPYTYPIQNVHTRDMIKRLKADLFPVGFYFTGRFVDWGIL